MALPWPSLGRRAGAMTRGYASFDDGSAHLVVRRAAAHQKQKPPTTKEDADKGRKHQKSSLSTKQTSEQKCEGLRGNLSPERIAEKGSLKRDPLKSSQPA